MPGRADRFDRFTERARQVLQLAQEEAQRFNHNYIGTEHILLGLVREKEGVAARVLTDMGVELNDIRGKVELIIGRGDRIVLGDIGLTPRAKKVMELAMDEARRLGHHYVGTEHLLLGLLREGEGIAAQVLKKCGVDLGKTRRNVLHILNQEPISPGAGTGEEGCDGDTGATMEGGVFYSGGGGPRANVLTCRIDDRDLDALDALVEAGIRSTRSDAASWLIHAGIEAHSQLFQRVYATVEQIRQLRTEAQEMARGISAEAAKPAPPDEEESPLAPEE
jgi:ATP-dependent Clp protease ATP-binding subunit ClpA